MKIKINDNDFAGKKFGKLTAIKRTNEWVTTGTNQSNGKKLTSRKWLFQCECGKKSKHDWRRVRLGHIISCGCSRKSEDPLMFAVQTIFQDYKWKAKKSGKSFSLSLKYFKELVTNKCYYCDAPPKKRRRRGMCFVNGIDRINSSKGYTKGNVRSCCTFCNRIKNKDKDTNFLDWLKRISMKYAVHDELNRKIKKN